MGVEGGKLCKQLIASDQISTRQEEVRTHPDWGPGTRLCLKRQREKWQPESLVVKRHLLLLGVNVTVKQINQC